MVGSLETKEWAGRRVYMHLRVLSQQHRSSDRLIGLTTSPGFSVAGRIESNTKCFLDLHCSAGPNLSPTRFVPIGNMLALSVGRRDRRGVGR